MKNSSQEECTRELKRVSAIVDAKLNEFLAEEATGPAADVYNMLRYFMGFVDADFKPIASEAGKRFRPSLCLLIAEWYGAQVQALEAAVAIELFHNFSLIHDDVEDRDEMRRNRPTVWKLWGVNHAINSGDVQSLLASQWCLRVARHSDVGLALADALLHAFVEVGEGQYFDFELADAPLNANNVNEEGYMRMIEKKSGALVRVSAEAAGIAAGQNAEECTRLREYGNSLGMAFQMADDYASIWSSEAETRKDIHSDIREHKRTLPFLHARTIVDQKSKARLDELYSLPRQLTDKEVTEAHSIMNVPSVREYVRSRALEHAARAKTAARELSINQEKRDILAGIVDTLVVC